VPGKLDALVANELEKLHIKADALIPEDEELYRFDLEQKNLLNMPDSSAAVQAVSDLMKKIR